MVYYARSSRSRKSYGTKRRGTYSRARRSLYGRKSSTRPRFATVSYKRDVETKYSDKALLGDGGLMKDVGLTSLGAIGWSGTSTTWRETNLAGNTSVGGPSPGAQDLLKGIGQGTTATTRVGNKITAKCLKIKVTMVAGYITNSSTSLSNGQYGESSIDTTAGVLNQYMRTTYRVLVVKDTQVNSTDAEITYDMVMETDGSGVGTGTPGGIHAEQKIANMGRFKVLADKVVNLDADDPMKTMKMNLYKLGNVRYNGPTGTALTDKGIYVIWAAFIMGKTDTSFSTPDPTLSQVVVSSRLCFTDD